MTASNFPNSPAVGDTYSNNGRTWIYTSAGVWDTSNTGMISGDLNVVGSLSSANWGSPNYIINGAFDIWQRDVLSTSNSVGYFTADRWRHSRDAVTGLVQSVEQVSLNGEIPELDATYYVKRTVTTAGSCTVLTYGNRVEDVRTLSNKTVTLSFWAKGSGDIILALTQNFGSGGSSTIRYTSSDFTVTSSWMRYTFTSTLGSVAGKTIGDNSFLEATLEIINVSDGVDVSFAGVQLEAGAVATQFRRNAPSIQAEIAACQRYFYRRERVSGNAYPVNLGFYNGATQLLIVHKHPVEMRDFATLTFSALAHFDIEPFDAAPSAIVITSDNTYGCEITVTDPNSRTVGQAATIAIDNSDGWIAFSAEL